MFKWVGLHKTGWARCVAYENYTVLLKNALTLLHCYVNVHFKIEDIIKIKSCICYNLPELGNKDE